MYIVLCSAALLPYKDDAVVTSMHEDVSHQTSWVNVHKQFKKVWKDNNKKFS